MNCASWFHFVSWFGLAIWNVWRACGLLHALRVPSRQAKSACGYAACQSDRLQRMPNQVRRVMGVGMLVSSLLFGYCWRALFAGNGINLNHGGNIANKKCQ